MKVKASKHVEAVEAAVMLANRFRLATGYNKILDDLPDAVPQNGKECILARAFNFDCVVNGSGVVHFPRDKQSYAEQLANLVNTIASYDAAALNGNGGYSVTIPDKIARLARAFDHHELDEYVAK